MFVHAAPVNEWSNTLKNSKNFFFKKQKENEQSHMPASESHRLKTGKLLKENKQMVQRDREEI